MQKLHIFWLFLGLTAAIGTLIMFHTYTKPQEKLSPLAKTTRNVISGLNNTSDKKSDVTVTLIATGDFIPARSVNYQALKYKDFTWTVKETANTVKGANDENTITFVSLETPIFEDCPVTNDGFIFCGEEGHIEALKLIGADVVNLANNHAGNYEAEGIEKTIAILEKAGIKYTGVNNIVYITAGGPECDKSGTNNSTENESGCTKFAFLGYNDIGYTPEPLSLATFELIEEQVTEAEQNADVVVVGFHWGVEYTTQITDRQKELAYFAIDNGADLIIGNHPHWVQPQETYKNKLIVYAHGNYVFDQMWSEETKEGVIGKYTFTNGELVKHDFTPIYITDYGKSQLADEARSKKILTVFD